MKNEGKPIILAVDDDPVILNAVRATLKEDYKVIPMVGAGMALKYLETNTADLILLDCFMPEMTGFEMFERILADDKLKEIPVIFLTGTSDEDGEATALQTGAADYITKPIRSRALLTRISMQLELHNYRKNLEKMVEDKTHMLNEALNLLKSREDVTLNLLAQITEMRDCDTGAHIERTTEFVKIMVNEILENPIEDYSLTPQEAHDIIKSAKLHDLGKIAVPDNILLKKGKLTPEEFNEIKKHPEAGRNLLSQAMEGMKSLIFENATNEYKGPVNSDTFLKTALDITYGHHEKWNGEGYPDGLAGMDIPLSARIVAVADVYDALTSERPYKEAFSHEESAEIIKNDSGRHFDPHLVNIFIKHADVFKNVSE